jgi:ABC-type nickel/cobalt efflux system permease component RcnA
MLQYFVLLAIGVVLGLEHSLEADHIVSVVNLTSRTSSTRRAVLLGTVWGMGHSVTLIAVSFIILITRLVIPERMALLLELLVGVLLIGLGIDTIWKVVHHRINAAPAVDLDPHTQRRSFLVGAVHGLAGSAALVLLVVSTFGSVVEGLVFITCFGVGLVIGMALITTLLTAPFKLSTRFGRINGGIRFAAGALSIVVGLSFIYNVSFVRGLFRV